MTESEKGREREDVGAERRGGGCFFGEKWKVLYIALAVIIIRFNEVIKTVIKKPLQ